MRRRAALQTTTPVSTTSGDASSATSETAPTESTTVDVTPTTTTTTATPSPSVSTSVEYNVTFNGTALLLAYDDIEFVVVRATRG